MTYHAMDRLSSKGQSGGNREWQSSVQLRVPDRPPAFDENWPKHLEASVDPDDEEEIERRRQEELKAKIEARQLAPRYIAPRINSPRLR